MKRQPPGGSTLDVQSLFAEPESERLKGVRGERRTRGRDRVFEEEMERMGGLGGGDGGDGGEGEGEGDGGRVGAEGGEAVEKEEVKGEEEEGEERYGKRRKVEDEV